jgi:hypothetical protein
VFEKCLRIRKKVLHKKKTLTGADGVFKILVLFSDSQVTQTEHADFHLFLFVRLPHLALLSVTDIWKPTFHFSSFAYILID